jgi:hypothetical protein
MTTVPRAGRWFALVPLLLAVLGCGPGVGGTGTGEGFALDFFGARAASVCTASFAAELKCPTRIVIGPARVDLTKGSEPVDWVDDPVSGRISAHISGSAVTFDAFCERVRFEGSWGTTDDGQDRFFGHFTAPGIDVATPGTLSVRSEGAGLSYVLRDSQGETVFGPVVLQAAEPLSASASCPQQSASPLLGVKYR